MCNYSEGILQKGIQKGLEQERKNSIITLISTLVELGNDESVIINKVVEKYNINPDLAKNFYSEYLQSDK